jgi:hypothetical protein
VLNADNFIANYLKSLRLRFPKIELKKYTVNTADLISSLSGVTTQPCFYWFIADKIVSLKTVGYASSFVCNFKYASAEQDNSVVLTD